MELTEKQKLELQFNLKIKETCSNCGSSEKPEILNAKIQLMSPLVQSGIINLDGPINTYPVIAVRCPNCGLISMFDAKHIGVDKL